MLRKTSLVTLMCSVTLAGCVHFMPQQKPEIVKRLSTVQDELAKAKTTLSLDSAATYTKIEPYMVAALAAAQQAVDLSTSRSNALEGKVEGEAAKRITAILTNCRDGIKADAIEMKKNGVPTNEADNIDAIAGNCHVGKFIEGITRQ